MATNGVVATGTRTSLQSEDTRGLLDIVDTLRGQGISRYIDLPQIIVCGDQSSGKSSVLEAISGLQFPSKDNLCTRFATELILRRGHVTPINISIVPGVREERAESEKKKLNDFNVSASEEDLQLDKVIEAAKMAMGIDDDTKNFTSDILRVELSGPEQPHLTLVDLPGLFHAGSRSQSVQDSQTVKSLVLTYMENPRSIILAVVSAKSDLVNQVVTQHSRDIDPKGVRTLGLITKPDTLDKGSDMERAYVETAQNKNFKLELGWHVLRNRDYAARDSTLHERNRAEEEFFATGIWTSLEASHMGVYSLKPRLSLILKEQIIAQLPDVLKQIQYGISECEEKLDILGTPRANLQEQRRYLLQTSTRFSNLIKAATDGLYADSFFGDAATDKGYHRRLRAKLQNILTNFASIMRARGHEYDIIEEGSGDGARKISRSDYITRVKTLLGRSRGRELPGTFDPLIIGELFHEQRRPWSGIVHTTVGSVITATAHVLHAILGHVSDPFTCRRLLKTYINPKMDLLTAALQHKVKELLEPHDSFHPITYNHYLTENVQKAQNARRTRELSKSLQKFFGSNYASDGSAYTNVNFPLLLKSLVDTTTEPDMNTYSASTATDFMEAYYKVALKKIIDDFAVLAIEACLIHKLDTIFCPSDVLEIDDQTISALASEDTTISTERSNLSEKLGVLQEGLRSLQGYQEHPSLPKDEQQVEDLLFLTPTLDIVSKTDLETRLVSPTTEPPAVDGEADIAVVVQLSPPSSLPSQMMVPEPFTQVSVTTNAVVLPKKKKKKGTVIE